MKRRSSVGIIDFSSDGVGVDDKQPKSYCRECLKFGFQVPLKNRIYPDNEPIPVDHENYLQCHECGLIVPVYEIEKEAEIKDVVETSDNPFDIGTSILGIDSRTSIGGKNARKKRERQRQLDDINDDDVERELSSGQTQLISYSEFMPQ